jgi:hypothetical protein
MASVINQRKIISGPWRSSSYRHLRLTSIAGLANLAIPWRAFVSPLGRPGSCLPLGCPSLRGGRIDLNK